MSSNYRPSPLDASPNSLLRRIINQFSHYAPGLVLIIWTVLPLSLAVIFVDLIGLICLYPFLCPFVWVIVAKWKPDKMGSTISLGIIGHVLLAVSLWFILDNYSWGNHVGFDFVGLLVIVALLGFSAIGSIVTILITDFFSAG